MDLYYQTLFNFSFNMFILKFLKEYNIHLK